MNILCADQQSMSNSSVTDAVEKYHPITRIRKQQEEKQNTRFNEVRQFAYVLGARKRDCFIDSITNTISCIHMKRTLPLYLQLRRPRRIRNLNWTRFQFRTEIRNLEGSACRSTGRSTEPCPGRPRRSTAPTREQSLVSRSTVRSTVLLLRSTGRSTVIACARWCTLVDRPVDRYLLSVFLRLWL